MKICSQLFRLVPAVSALVLYGCGGGSSLPPPDNPNPPPAAWSEPQLLATAQVATAEVQLVRANPAGGVLLSWSSYASNTARQGFAESTQSGGRVTELPEALNLTGWAWDDAGPSSAVGVRDPVGSTNAEAATWLRSASGWSAPVTLRAGTSFMLAGAARAAGSAMQLLYRAIDSPLEVMRYTPGEGWSAPLAIGGPDETGGPQVAIGPHEEAMVASPAGWRTFTAANGWSALRPWPFPTGAIFEAQALEADGAGNFHMAAIRCPVRGDVKSCEPFVARYSPVTGWGEPTAIAPGAGYVLLKLHVSPAGHLVAWYFVPGPFFFPAQSELRVVVGQPGGGWTPYAVLAPLQDEFWPTASFVALDSGRVVGAWNFGRGRIEGAVYSPGTGWSSPQTIQQGPQAITFGRLGVVMDQDVPTAVWGVGPIDATSTTFYQSRFR